MASMDRVGRMLGSHLTPLWRVLDALPDAVRRLRVAASGAFTLFPPAMLLDRRGVALVDRFEIVSALHGEGFPRARSGDIESATLIAVADPTGDLPHSRSEGLMLAALFSERTTLVGAQASKQRVIDAIRGAAPVDYLHLSCHGRYQWRHPERSGLVLAGGELLSLSDISEHVRLSANTVVVLPACETGLTEYRELPDESYGLALAFLTAGAGTVIGTLWPVPDRSTKLLMLKLYKTIRAGASPAMALRTAQLWLRDTPWSGFQVHIDQLSPDVRRAGELEGTIESLRLKQVPAESPQASCREHPFEHPFYWAGFVCIA